MNVSLNAQLSRLGLKYKDGYLIGQGGQLATYLVDVVDKLSGEDRKVVVKRIQADKDLASIYGYSPVSMLECEALYTTLLGSKGLGPSVLLNNDGVVIREYFEGDTLSNIFVKTDKEKSRVYLKETLSFLERVLSIMENEQLQGYIDFNCNNILRDDVGKYSLIDHEWTIFQYQTHEDLCVNTLYKYFRSVVRNTVISFDEIFELVLEYSYFSRYIVRVQAQLVAGYFNVNDVSYQISLLASDELQRQLRQWQTGTPKEVLEQFCARLGERGIRYCFARRYDNLFSEGGYQEKDIDLFVDPDDYHSFILLAQEAGFTLYNLTKFLYYSGVTGQVVFLDVCLQKSVGSPSVLGVRQVVTNADFRQGRRIISDLDLFILLIINAAKQRKTLSSKYYEFLQEGLLEKHFNFHYIESALQEAFGEKEGAQILKLVEAGSWSELEDVSVPSFRGKITKSGLRKRVGELMVDGPRLIAILGVDGAGKSTTASAVKNALADVKLPSENYYLGCYYPPSGRGQSFILPTDLMVRFGYKLLLTARKFKIIPKKMTSSTPSVQKYNAKHYVYDAGVDEAKWRIPLEQGGECSMFIFRVYAWILAIDCALMGAKLRMILRGSFVFTDRYFYDLITFLGGRHILSRWIARFFEPDAALFLYASPEVQVRREPRHPLSEIKENQALYRTIPVLNPKVNWHEILTELPLEVVVQRVLFLCMTAPRRKSIFKIAANICKAVFGRLL